MIDLSPVVAAETLINRLELGGVEQPLLQRLNDDTGVYETLLALDPGEVPWDIREVVTLGGNKPFLRLRLLDNGSATLREAMARAEYLVYDNWRWKLARENEPFGATPLWLLRLERFEQLSPGYPYGADTALLDLSPVNVAEMFIARLELKDTLALPVLLRSDDALDSGWNELLTLDPDVYPWELREVTNFNTGKSFLRMRIQDTGATLRTALLNASTMRYDGWVWKISKEVEPFGVNRTWVLRLTRTERAGETTTPTSSYGYGYGYGLSYGARTGEPTTRTSGYGYGYGLSYGTS